MKVVKEQPSKIPKNPATFELTGGKASREGMDNLEYLQKLVKLYIFIVFFNSKGEYTYRDYC